MGWRLPLCLIKVATWAVVVAIKSELVNDLERFVTIVNEVHISHR